MQFDWAEFTYGQDGVKRKLYGFAVILCSSRLRFVTFVNRCDTPTLLRFFIEACEYYRSTHEHPLDRRVREPLSPLPAAFAWERYATEERKVSWDGYLSYDGVVYGLSSEPPLAGTAVQVREQRGVLSVWPRGQSIALAVKALADERSS